ncbi:hypothetical protein CHUAL_003216 [Chamberlinius hualienensis]
MPKKKFIDKKNSVTFRLVHRSQRDPLVADEAAPQHVLVQQGYSKQDRPTSSVFKKNNESGSDEKRKLEQVQYGIYFDDNYDYLQHLKDVTNVPISGILPDSLDLSATLHDETRLVLPSSVFASNVEEGTGLLNKAAPTRGPRPDWDPDIVATLDEDFNDADVEELDDDFILQANAPGSDEQLCSDDEDTEVETDADNSYENTDSDYERDGFLFEKEETKSRFTNYSMSSSVVKRNEGLTLVDDQFEKFYEDYDDDRIGALDDDAADGFIKPGNQILERAIQEFQDGMMMNTLSLNDVNETVKADVYESSTDEELEIVEEDPTAQWDCESILSTYSTIYNHPKLIDEPRRKLRLTKKNARVLDDGKSDVKENNDDKSGVKEKRDFRRSLNETPEEKKERKKAVKEHRRERREEKKATTKLYKEEDKRQKIIMANARQNIQGIKLA